MNAALLNAGGEYPVDADDYTTAVIPAEATFVSVDAFANLPNLDTLIVNGDCEFEHYEETVDKYTYYYNAITKYRVPIRKLVMRNRTKIPAYFMREVGPLLEIAVSGELDRECFYYCTYLRTVTLENCLYIGINAFQKCSNLTKITIPDGVKSIANGAFNYCDNLTEVTIPDSVQSIGYNAFGYCAALTTITILGAETTIEGTSAIPSTTTIRGYAGSAAETFATENGYTFEVIA